jgi:hypothetical protein
MAGSDFGFCVETVLSLRLEISCPSNELEAGVFMMNETERSLSTGSTAD